MSTRHRSPVSEHQTPVSFIRHRSTKHWATRHLSTRHRSTRIFATRHRSTRHWATRYGLASTGQPGTGQPGTSHSSSRHQSLFDDYQAPFTSHWAPVNVSSTRLRELVSQSPDSSHRATRHRSTRHMAISHRAPGTSQLIRHRSSGSKRLALKRVANYRQRSFEQSLANEPSVVVDPPTNTCESSNRQASLSRQ